MLLPADRPGEVAQILDRIRSGGRVVQFQTVRVAKDGRELPVSLNISPILDEAGQVEASDVSGQGQICLLRDRGSKQPAAPLR